MAISDKELLSVKQASEWATQYLDKTVTTSNIAYLIQYGRVRKIGNNGNILINKDELLKYYQSYLGKREVSWKKQLGDDLNWALSFDHLKESERTKHVHRLHPYKGKFIPQLVEYFLDKHTDEFKKSAYFKEGDIILDPFAGSGTTLVQSAELGIHAVGIDVSAFNTLISNVKLGEYDFADLHVEMQRITRALRQFVCDSKTVIFEEELLRNLAEFNDRFFPSPDFKYKIKRHEINEDEYGAEKEKQFLPIYEKLVKDYDIKLEQRDKGSFLDKWYLHHVRKEIDFIFDRLKGVQNKETKKILTVILSRTIRSCRATTHSDLATLKQPITKAYYCTKHGKICKPLFSIVSWWERYCKDTIQRLNTFSRLRTDTHQVCIAGDSRTIDIIAALQERNNNFACLVRRQKIKGIFSSPPYVGLIDYHEQHAYAYSLFGFERKDELEIGPLSKGQGREAKESYIDGIASVLINCRRFMMDDLEIFLVANDKFNLYPTIVDKAGMRIYAQFKRPVLNRTERDRNVYAESIFHIRPR